MYKPICKIFNILKYIDFQYFRVQIFNFFSNKEVQEDTKTLEDKTYEYFYTLK